MAQQLTALVSLPEDRGSISSTHIELTTSSGDPMPSSILHGHCMHVGIQTQSGKTPTHRKYKIAESGILHDFNPNTQEPEVDRSLSLSPVWSTEFQENQD